jgi:rhodanese-related sulfurtransferase
MNVIDHADLAAKFSRNENFLLVNVLPADYFSIAHIPGSLNIPLDTPAFEEVVARTAASRDREIILYCANMSCSMSSQAARNLEEAGFTNITDFAGGTQEWKDAGNILKSSVGNGSCGCSGGSCGCSDSGCGCG